MLGFFRREARALPWRADRSWYRVLVSEMMLQQTRVETVVPYFERWMARFPTAARLAAASEEEVLGAWQGLGYYARARNLHSAVREIVTTRAGKIPEDAAELQDLPGVGRYTAGAVASIAFGRPAPIVDGNVRRVLARLSDSPSPSASTLWAWAGALVDPEDPGGFNQGLMELGATVCVPGEPICGRCPLSPLCGAFERGTAATRPLPRPRQRPPAFIEAAVVLLQAREGPCRVLLRRRPEEGLLAGMWELPGAGVPAAEVAETVARDLAGAFVHGSCFVAGLTPVDHAFTHRRVRYLPFLFTVPMSTARLVEPCVGIRWVEAGPAMAALPIPAAQRKILTLALETDQG